MHEQTDANEDIRFVLDRTTGKLSIYFQKHHLLIYVYDKTGELQVAAECDDEFFYTLPAPGTYVVVTNDSMADFLVRRFRY